jgi:hypothetical protein
MIGDHARQFVREFDALIFTSRRDHPGAEFIASSDATPHAALESVAEFVRIQSECGNQSPTRQVAYGLKGSRHGCIDLRNRVPIRVR